MANLLEFGMNVDAANGVGFSYVVIDVLIVHSNDHSGEETGERNIDDDDMKGNNTTSLTLKQR